MLHVARVGAQINSDFPVTPLRSHRVCNYIPSIPNPEALPPRNPKAAQAQLQVGSLLPWERFKKTQKNQPPPQKNFHHLGIFSELAAKLLHPARIVQRGGGGAVRAPARRGGRGGRRSPGGGRAEPAPGWRRGNARRGWHGGSCSGVDGSADVRVCVSCYCRKQEIPERARTRRTRRHLTMRERSCTPEGRDRPERPAACPGEGRDRTESPPAHTYRHHPDRPAGGGGPAAATAPPRRRGSGLR